MRTLFPPLHGYIRKLVLSRRLYWLELAQTSVSQKMLALLPAPILMQLVYPQASTRISPTSANDYCKLLPCCQPPNKKHQHAQKVPQTQHINLSPNPERTLDPTRTCLPRHPYSQQMTKGCSKRAAIVRQKVLGLPGSGLGFGVYEFIGC